MPSDASGPYTVLDVVDGDTLKVDMDGKRTTIRVIGLDTPETRDPRKPVQCFGREASRQAHALLDGHQVRLSSDPTQDAVDKYGRMLAYVWLPDGRLFQHVMIAEGYGHEYTYEIPYEHHDAFKAAQRSAREQGRGLWSPQSCNGDTGQPESPDTAQDEGPEPGPTASMSPPSAVSTSGVTSSSPATVVVTTARPSLPAAPSAACDPNYTGACIPPYPPDLDCGQVGAKNFPSVGTDPHRLDADRDGVACET